MNVMKFDDFAASILQVADTVDVNDFPKTLRSTTAYNKGAWSYNEDCSLRQAYDCVFKGGGQLSGKQTRAGWRACSKLVGSRNTKQCRERWHKHLDPRILKTPYTELEDNILLSKHSRHGDCWKKISTHLPGRSDDSVKIRFRALTKSNAPAGSSRSIRQPGDLCNDR